MSRERTADSLNPGANKHEPEAEAGTGSLQQPTE